MRAEHSLEQSRGYGGHRAERLVLAELDISLEEGADIDIECLGGLKLAVVCRLELRNELKKVDEDADLGANAETIKDGQDAACRVDSDLGFDLKIDLEGH